MNASGTCPLGPERADGAASEARVVLRTCMPSNELQGALDTLHREISSAKGLDAATHAKLVEAIREITAERDQSEALDAERAGLPTRIRDAVKHFEEEHPDLVAAVGRVADMLASAGL